jgi:hypothetical protein
MSEERDPESSLPRHFSISVNPSPERDEDCPATNGSGTKKGVCVGVNTNDCHEARGALAIDDFLSCEDCFVGLVTDISYDLEVEDFKLKRVSVGLENMHLMGALQFLAHQAASKTVAKGAFPIINEDTEFNINFLVAEVIPVNINFKIPTELTYAVTLSESVDLRFGGDVDVALGDHSVEWSSGDGWNMASTSQSVSWTPVLQASGKVAADMPVGLKSTLMVEFEKVLDYSMIFTPSLPLHAEMSLDSGGKDEICLSSNANFEIDHEAKLHFKLFGHDETIADWGPEALYQHHWSKVFDKCWDLPVPAVTLV